MHDATHIYDQSQTDKHTDRSEAGEKRQVGNGPTLSHIDAPIAELSHEALDVLAAEISTAKAARDSSPLSITQNKGRMEQGGPRRRASGLDESFNKVRHRSSQLRQPFGHRERHVADSNLPYKKEEWQTQKAVLKEKFPEGWQPRKKLSPDALAGIRALHEQFPEDYTTEVLANKFEVSPEAIRRILKSKWEPSPEEEEERQQRWFNRGKQVWSRWAELGKKPPTRWRDEGIERKPYRRQRHYDDEEGEEVDLHKTGNNRLIARSKLAKNLM